MIGRGNLSCLVLFIESIYAWRMVPHFALQSDYIVAGFNHVMAQTDLSADIHAAILPAWIYAVQSGNPRFGPAALRLLIEVDWTWTRYETLLAGFREMKSWPVMWKHCGFDQLDGRHGDRSWRKCKVRLLSHTIWSTGVECRLATESGPGMARKGWRLAVVGDCPFEVKVAAGMEAQVVIGDFTTYPPFFPGDRTMIAHHTRKV
jgi:hypothetical protein